MNGFKDKAYSYIRKAIKTSENVYGKDNLEISRNYKNFGQILKLNRDFNKAYSFTKKALDIEKKLLPYYHKEIGSTYHGLASIEFERKNFKKAKILYEKSAEIFRNTELNQSREIANVYRDLGGLNLMQGSFEESLKEFEKTLSIYKKLYRNDHPEISKLSYQIANVQSKLKKYSESNTLFENAVENDLIYLQKEIPLLSLKDRQAFYSSNIARDRYLFDVAIKNKNNTKIALLRRINKQGLLEEIEKRQINLRSLNKEAKILKDDLIEVNALIANVKVTRKEKEKLISKKVL